MVHRLLADGIFLLNFQVHLGTLVHLPVSQLLLILPIIYLKWLLVLHKQS